MAEQINFVDALRKLIDSKTGEINTSLPGVIVSYANGRATVQPTPKRRFADGDVLPFPILQNVRVCWPSFAGGMAGVKGPVLAGDKCLIVFAQQAVDGSDDMRRFDISDSYVIPCDLGTTGAGDSGNNADLTVFYGPGAIRISASGSVTITAPGGVSIDSPSVSNNGTLSNSGAVSMASTLLVSSQVTLTTGATVGGIEFANHKHTGVTTGPGNTGGPIA